MNPTVSIIVPVYNAEAYLHRCVDSILTQKYTDFELIFIVLSENDSPTKAISKMTMFEFIWKLLP